MVVRRGGCGSSAVPQPSSPSGMSSDRTAAPWPAPFARSAPISVPARACRGARRLADGARAQSVASSATRRVTRSGARRSTRLACVAPAWRTTFVSASCATRYSTSSLAVQRRQVRSNPACHMQPRALLQAHTQRFDRAHQPVILEFLRPQLERDLADVLEPRPHRLPGRRRAPQRPALAAALGHRGDWSHCGGQCLPDLRSRTVGDPQALGLLGRVALAGVLSRRSASSRRASR